MKHRASPRFWSCYHQLPAAVQRAADDAYCKMCDNPRHPSLRLKKVGKLWSVRIGLNYRALAVDADPDLLWVWIGTHAEYDRILKQA